MDTDPPGGKGREEREEKVEGKGREGREGRAGVKGGRAGVRVVQLRGLGRIVVHRLEEGIRADPV